MMQQANVVVRYAALLFSLIATHHANAGFFGDLVDSIKSVVPSSGDNKDASPAQEEKKDNVTENQPSIVTPLIGKAALAMTTDEMRAIIDAYEQKLPQTSDDAYLESRINLPTTFGGCAVPRSDITGYKQALSKSKGLLLPVFTAEFSKEKGDKSKDKYWDSLIDWPATENTHALLRNNAKLNLAPVSETRKAWARMKKYLEQTMNKDTDAYYQIAKSGGGGLGQLWGSATKSDVYGVINNPNIRLSGYVRSNYYEEVLREAGDDVVYVVTVGEPKAIIDYFFELGPRVKAKLSPESIQLNLQKDMTGVIETSLYSALNFYYGLIDEKRASESSLQGMIAGSFVKVRVHTRGLPDNEIKARESLRRLIDTLEPLLLVTRSNLVTSVSFSMMDKYKTLAKEGVDTSRVLCGSLNKKLAVEQSELDEKLAYHRNLLTKATGMEGAITMYMLTDEYRQNPALAQEVVDITKRALDLYGKVVKSSAGSGAFASGSVIPVAVTDIGLSGYISSKKLK